MAQFRPGRLRSLSLIDARHSLVFSAALCVSLRSLRQKIFMTKFIWAVVVVLLFSFTALAARVERLIDTWRPEHYSINVTLNNQLTEITSASARINILVLKPTSLIDLDFGDLTTDTVALNSQPVSFAH